MLVKESLYNFKRGEDPITATGLGKKQSIENWLNTYNIENYRINDDYTVDVRGDVNLYNKNLAELPEYIQFGIVVGNFDISKNKLKTLKGCPSKVGRDFVAYSNKLKSLEFLPIRIEGDLYLSGNNGRFLRAQILNSCDVRGDIIL